MMGDFGNWLFNLLQIKLKYLKILNSSNLNANYIVETNALVTDNKVVIRKKCP